MKPEDHICTICARTAVGYGYAPSSDWNRTPVLWVCDDPHCLQLARNAYTQLQLDFSRWESLAAEAGGREAGQYLDEIGITNLAAMSPDQWRQFCRRLIAGYRAALKIVVREEAPF